MSTTVKPMSKKEINRRLGRIIIMALLAVKRATSNDQKDGNHETGNRTGTS
jgi:hypothetical protein